MMSMVENTLGLLAKYHLLTDPGGIDSDELGAPAIKYILFGWY